MQKERILAIDDEREHRTATVLCRTFRSGIDALAKCGPWNELLLDHDLADFNSKGREMTGYDIALYLEACFFNGDLSLLPHKVTVVSSNGPGLANIGRCLDQFMNKKGPRTWILR